MGSETLQRSEQMRRFLQFICEKEIDGDVNQISEYVIGIEVFGKAEGYSITEDSTVRKRAYELRQKLERLYTGELQDAAVQIEMPKGSYVPRFVSRTVLAEPIFVPASTEAVTTVSHARRVPWLVAALIVLLAAVAWVARPREALDEFWRPVLSSPGETMICVGHPVVYRFSKEFHESINQNNATHYQILTEPLRLPPNTVLRGSDIVPVPNQFIGIGSAEAVASIYGWLATHQKQASLHFGNALTFAELRRSPAVIIGAFNNKWALELTKDLRFIFDNQGGAPVVRDRQTGKIWSLPGLLENGETNEDYVVISRLPSSTTGQTVIAAAGITQYGGRTVSEVLTQPGLIAQFVKGASRDWAKHNLQMVFHVKVIGGTAGPPELIALHEW